MASPGPQGHLPGCLSVAGLAPGPALASHSGLVKDHAGSGKGDLPKWDLKRTTLKKMQSLLFGWVFTSVRHRPLSPSAAHLCSRVRGL